MGGRAWFTSILSWPADHENRRLNRVTPLLSLIVGTALVAVRRWPACSSPGSRSARLSGSQRGLRRRALGLGLGMVMQVPGAKRCRTRSNRLRDGSRDERLDDVPADRRLDRALRCSGRSSRNRVPPSSCAPLAERLRRVPEGDQHPEGIKAPVPPRQAHAGLFSKHGFRGGRSSPPCSWTAAAIFRAPPFLRSRGFLREGAAFVRSARAPGEVRDGRPGRSRVGRRVNKSFRLAHLPGEATMEVGIENRRRALISAAARTRFHRRSASCYDRLTPVPKIHGFHLRRTRRPRHPPAHDLTAETFSAGVGLARRPLSANRARADSAGALGSTGSRGTCSRSPFAVGGSSCRAVASGSDWLERLDEPRRRRPSRTDVWLDGLDEASGRAFPAGERETRVEACA